MGETTTKLILDGDPNGLVAAVNRGRNSVGELETGVLSMNRSILGTSAAVGIFAYGLREVTQAANQTVSANMGLATTARYAGAGIEEANRAAKELTKDGLMSVTEASKGLQNLLSRGFSLPEAIQLMDRFKDSASFNRQAALGFGEAVVTATEGLKNENSILVDNAGVTKNVSVMWKEYAAQIGVGADSLTQAQKRHAELNGIMRETEGQLGNAARMADFFAGSQAKAAQQTFELKSSLGVALQPALTAVLTILTPVVSGVRDMVYWVETLGARAGATYDRLKLRAEIALSGKGMFSKEGLDEFETRSKSITDALDETINDIVKRSMGATTPDIGNDTGKRRQDVVVPPKAPKAGKADKAEKINLGVDADGAVQAYRAEQAEIQKIKTEMHWNDVAETNAKNRADEQAEFEHTQTLAGLQNTLSQKRMLARGEESEALDAQFMYEQQQADAQTQWKLDHTYLEEEEISRIKAEHGERRLIAEQELAQRQADLWAQGAQTYLGYAESMTTLGVSMLLSEEQQKGEIGSRMLATSVRFIAQGLQNFMFSKAKEHLLAAASLKGQIAAKATQATSEMAIGATQASAWAAFYAAHSLNPIGAAVYGASAAAMTAAAGGFGAAGAAVLGVGAAGAGATVAGELGMAAAWGAGGVAVGAIGSAGATAIESGSSGNAAGYGGGTSFSPVITQPVGGTQGGGINITVKIEGNVISDDRWVEERLAPAIKDLATNRNVDFGLVTV